MIVSYDMTLVLLSLSLAILGAYTGFSILPATGLLGSAPYKIRIGAAALVIGGGTWSMHFLGMLALHLPVEIDYSVAPTVTSFFAAILLTGLGLFAGTSGHLGRYKALSGGLLIGFGVIVMHYIGMEAVRAACSVTYSSFGIVVSYLLGSAIAILALKIVAQPESRAQVIVGAVALGAAISCIHYVGILNTRFAFSEGAVFLSEPVLKSGYLASIVALTTFLLCGTFLGLALPNEKHEAIAWQPGSIDSGLWSALAREDTAVFSRLGRWLADPRRHHMERTYGAGDRSKSAFGHVALESPEPGGGEASNDKGRVARLALLTRHGTRFINLNAIQVVSADGHYTNIGTITSDGKFERQFCERSITSIAAMLPVDDFIRVHRSHIVNIHQVTGYCRKGDGGELMLGSEGAPRIPVSRSRYTEVVARVQSAACAG